MTERVTPFVPKDGLESYEKRQLIRSIKAAASSLHVLLSVAYEGTITEPELSTIQKLDLEHFLAESTDEQFLLALNYANSEISNLKTVEEKIKYVVKNPSIFYYLKRAGVLE